MRYGITAEKKMVSRRVVSTRALAIYHKRIAVMALGLACIILFFAVIPAFAGGGDVREKLYTDYEIQPGDSLSAIAGEYSDPAFGDTSSFISEVMAINHITDPDSIHAGSYIVIPYYEDSSVSFK